MSRDATIIPLLPRLVAAELAQRSDDELMSLGGAGMIEAFSELVRRYERPVRALCARMLGGAGPGDDAAQEVFLDLWRSSGRYEAQGRFRAFLFTAVRHRCLNEARARSRRIDAGSADVEQVLVEAAPHDQVEALLAAERRQRLGRLVDRLPAKLGDAIRLRYVAELEYAEIAEIVKRSEETVRGRIFHGLKRLRKLMEHEGHEDLGPEKRRP